MRYIKGVCEGDDRLEIFFTSDLRLWTNKKCNNNFLSPFLSAFTFLILSVCCCFILAYYFFPLILFFSPFLGVGNLVPALAAFAPRTEA